MCYLHLGHLLYSIYYVVSERGGRKRIEREKEREREREWERGVKRGRGIRAFDTRRQDCQLDALGMKDKPDVIPRFDASWEHHRPKRNK
jgi:hypothetical protein